MDVLTPNAEGLASPADARKKLETALFEVKHVIVGQEAMLERVFVALLTGGHLLIEGVPGLAKTLTIRTTAEVLGGTFHRIQFTPDLVPSDLVGTRIFRADTGTFETELGPVFCNFLLADEINRAPAKVQSALLEVMQERQVTMHKETHPVPVPFLVMATQNPIESEGTYPLPEAQLDRFMMKVLVDYPGFSDEMSVVQRSLGEEPHAKQVLSVEELQLLQKTAAAVYVDNTVTEYAVTLVTCTRHLAHYGLEPFAQYVTWGASPRGSLNLVHAGRAMALMRGRNYVLPQDVFDIARDVLRHRIGLSYQALSEERTCRRRARRHPRPHPGAAHRPCPQRGHCVTSPRPQLRWDDPRLDERVETPYTASSRRAPRTPVRGSEAAIRALDLTVRKRIDGLLAGDHRTSLPGLGTELHQLRAYEPGDDVRQIEWNVTARTGEPHVQVQLAERSLTTWLVLDISPSMNFGTAMMRKLDAAEGVALAIGHLATRRGNRLGVVTFGGPGVQILPPRQGRSGLLGVLTTLEQGPPADGPGSTTLTDALQRAAGLTRGTGLVAIVADFRGTQDWEAPLGRIAHRHAVIAVEVADPREESLPDIGEVEFIDPESGRILRVDTADRQLRERFAQKSLEDRRAMLAAFQRHGVEHVRCTTEGHWLHQLADFLRRPGVRK